MLADLAIQALAVIPVFGMDAGCDGVSLKWGVPVSEVDPKTVYALKYIPVKLPATLRPLTPHLWELAPVGRHPHNSVECVTCLVDFPRGNLCLLLHALWWRDCEGPGGSSPRGTIRYG